MRFWRDTNALIALLSLAGILVYLTLR